MSHALNAWREVIALYAEATTVAAAEPYDADRLDRLVGALDRALPALPAPESVVGHEAPVALGLAREAERLRHALVAILERRCREHVGAAADFRRATRAISGYRAAGGL